MAVYWPSVYVLQIFINPISTNGSCQQYHDKVGLRLELRFATKLFQLLVNEDVQFPHKRQGKCLRLLQYYNIIQVQYEPSVLSSNPNESGIFQLKCSKAYHIYKLYKFILCNKNGNWKSKIVFSWVINCSVCWWCHWWTCFPSRSLQILPSRCPHPRPRQLMLWKKDELLFQPKNDWKS